MKRLAIIPLLILSVSSFAQTSTAWIFGGNDQTTDGVSCYRATPAIAQKTEKGQQLFQSTDGGTTWQDLTTGLPEGIEIASSLATDSGVYIGTGKGELYFNSDPLTKSWELQQIEGTTYPGPIFGIHQRTSGLYARIYQDGLYKHVSGTNTWKPMHQNLKDKDIFCVIETEGVISIASNGGIFQTKDQGENWKQIYSDSWVNNLVYGSGVILANTQYGLIRSDDNGKHWSLAVDDVGGYYDINYIDGYWIAIRLGGAWKSATERTQYIISSMDGGVTWSIMDAGTPQDPQIYDLLKMNDYLLSSRSAGISRSNDFGQTWQLLLTLPTDDGSLRFDMVTNGSTIFAYLRQAGC